MREHANIKNCCKVNKLELRASNWMTTASWRCRVMSRSLRWLMTNPGSGKRVSDLERDVQIALLHPMKMKSVMPSWKSARNCGSEAAIFAPIFTACTIVMRNLPPEN